jgi:hypothetical protein
VALTITRNRARRNNHHVVFVGGISEASGQDDAEPLWPIGMTTATLFAPEAVELARLTEELT